MTVETQQDSNSADGGASVLTEMLGRLATDCGGRLIPGTRETEGFCFSMRDLAAFVSSVEKREREACAKIAEATKVPRQIGEGTPCACGEELAEIIRERSNDQGNGPRKAQLAEGPR